jgi:hypothetical protein
VAFIIAERVVAGVCLKLMESAIPFIDNGLTLDFGLNRFASNQDIATATISPLIDFSIHDVCG